MKTTQTLHNLPMAETIIRKLSDIVGADNVLNGLAERTFFSTDIASSGKTASAVVKVCDSAQLSAVVACCTRMGLAVIPRGGGFSYTGGYIPLEADSVIVDMRGINQVFEINETDLYVRVGTGCTWRVLYETLKERGFRTPYYGPMSGYNATVGGALSQGSFFLGSTEFGTTSDSVLSLEVVLANGDIIHTGSDSAADVAPFFRNYGPDLTGVFLGDTGALGFKTAATLKLIRWPEYQAYGSFSFKSGQDALAAVSEIGRSGIAAEAYVWDPYFVKLMSEASTSTRQDLGFLLGVVRNGAGLVDGLSAGLRIAMAGKTVFRIGSHMLQCCIDDHSAAGAAHRLKQVRAIALRFNATEVAPSVPRALRGTPFTDFNIPERRTHLRNLPTNSLYPHSKAPAALIAIRQLFSDNVGDLETHGMTIGVVYFAVGKNAVCIEPLFYWNDPRHFAHNRVDQYTDLATLDSIAEEPEATRFAFALREKLKAVMKAHGAVHVQIGKSYDYLPSREPRVAALLRDIKASLDPDNLVNPGSLGLGQ